MRFFKSAFTVLAALAALTSAPAWAQMKIGFVDYGRLRSESPQAKVAEQALKSEFAPKEQQLVSQQQALKSREEKLNKDRATMTTEQFERAQKEFANSGRDFNRRRAELQEDFNARMNEEMSKLQRTLIEEVRSYAKAQSFDLIIADGVIYASNTVDITPAVLAALASRGGKPAAAPTTPTPKPGGR